MMGTRRIGPDLTRAGGTRTENWHLVHLFAPRSVVPLSVMPSYAALFDGSPDKPRQEARDLVAYIESLGRARELAWPEVDEAARAAVPDDKWAQMSLNAPVLNAHPGRTRPRGNAPTLSASASPEAGRKLWTDNCSGCHGNEGRGDGPASEWLSPQPTNLTAREYTIQHVSDTLWNGVHGTAMPGWRDHSTDNLAALAAVVRDFSEVSDQSSPSASELALGASVYAGNCAECHGDAGAGDGYAASELPVTPTDFRSKRLSIAESIRVLRNGVAGTSMAPWNDRLSDDDMLAVAQYVRQFFVPDDNASGDNR